MEILARLLDAINCQRAKEPSFPILGIQVHPDVKKALTQFFGLSSLDSKVFVMDMPVYYCPVASDPDLITFLCPGISIPHKLESLRPTTINCECGMEKHGFANHSHWCPKHESGNLCP